MWAGVCAFYSSTMLEIDLSDKLGQLDKMDHCIGGSSATRSCSHHRVYLKNILETLDLTREYVAQAPEIVNEHP